MNEPTKTRDARGSGSSGGPQDYATPRAFLDALEARFGKIALDLAANERNHVCANWLGPGGIVENSLVAHVGTIFASVVGGHERAIAWLNPPFANIAPWAQLCAREASASCPIAFLVPASVGANWYWDHVYENALTLSVGRMNFVFRNGDHEAPACFDAKGKPTPFQKDLMLCVFGSGQTEKLERWRWKEANVYPQSHV